MVVDVVFAVEGEKYDLDSIKGYLVEKDELESIMGSLWKLRLKLATKEGSG